MTSTAAPAPPPTIHAGCVLVDEAGILIRGASGTGKSRLALALVAGAQASGRFARLVSDDRCSVSASNGRLVARPPAALAGLLEVRGLGLVEMEAEGAAVVRLVVDCDTEAPERYPQSTDRTVTVEGVTLPRIRVLAGEGGVTAAVILGLLPRFERPMLHVLSER
ncbi:MULTISPECIES: HPr kinase/phosphorylase [unclassified Chelatococcus]|uniref:HPr kinase/phosphorylase n=1 Tax=unclassified Chelatococcus TaxID=2638111 RepID=UPI0002F341FA|nr:MULTISPECIES: HPr kinase/phosphatase C-terminal domain-containing protein [unclassified Chelatococcus]